jgi:serine/threonine protein kinase
MISNRFKILKNLGKGASGEVKLVYDIPTSNFYACKIYNQSKNP